MGIGAGLDGMKNLGPPTGIRFADRSSRSVVAVPTELSRLPCGRSFNVFLHSHAGALGTPLSADNRDKNFLGLLPPVSLQLHLFFAQY